jgi:hypothetical protein
VVRAFTGQVTGGRERNIDMFRVLLVTLFALALVAQVSAQDKKDDTPAKNGGDETLTVLKEIRDAVKEKPVEQYVGPPRAWYDVSAERVTAIAPIVLLVLIAVVLIGMRSDITELLKDKKS